MAELIARGKTGSRSSLAKLPPRIDLTAMVDLAFLLITFFILATTLSKPKAMPLVMPAQGPPGAVAESSTVTICLGKNNQVLWYRGMINKPLTAPQLISYNKNGLRKMLAETNKQLKAAGKSMMVILKPSDHSQYANLVAALDELSITGVPSYAIAKISPPDIALLLQQKAY